MAAAAAVLREGGLVAFPTETVYGLGADALNATAVSNIYKAKGRPSNNPLIVHLHDVSEVDRVVSSWPPQARDLAERFWPGPLTMVLPRRPELPDVVTGGGDTVAVRIPLHPVALAFIAAAGVPVVGPSANRSSTLSPTRAEHVLHSLANRIDMVLDAGPCTGGVESTVLDLVSSPPRVLRPGLVTPHEIAAVIGPVSSPTLQFAKLDGPVRSPGMLTRHYAPRAVLECVGEGLLSHVAELVGRGLKTGVVAFDADANGAPEGVLVIRMPREARAYAARLYAVLHDLDAAGVDRIVVEDPPATEEWLAVSDRLLRASARR